MGEEAPTESEREFLQVLKYNGMLAREYLGTTLSKNEAKVDPLLLITALENSDRDIALGAASTLATLRPSVIGDQLQRIVQTLEKSTDIKLRVVLWPLLFDVNYPGIELKERTQIVTFLRRSVQDAGLAIAVGAEDERVRIELLRALVHFGWDSPGAFRLLRNFANSASYPIESRRVAAWGVAVSHFLRAEPEARKELVKRLTDPNEDDVLRRYAARGVAAYLDEEAVQALSRIIRERNASLSLRVACVRSLMFIAVSLQTRSSSNLRASLRRLTLGQLATENTPKVIAHLLILLRLVITHEREEVELLLRFIDHPDQEIAGLAADMLHESLEEPRPALLSMLIDHIGTQSRVGDNHRLATYLLIEALSLMDSSQINDLPYRDRELLRALVPQLRADKTSGTDQATNDRNPIEFTLLLDEHIQPWENGPAFEILTGGRVSGLGAPLEKGVLGAPDDPSTLVDRNPPPITLENWSRRTFPPLPRSTTAVGQSETHRLVFRWDTPIRRARIAENVELVLARDRSAWIASAQKRLLNNGVGLALVATFLVALLSLTCFGMYFLASRKPWRLADVAQGLRRVDAALANILPAQVRISQVSIVLRWIICIAPFEKRGKVIDAWIERHMHRIREKFEMLESVSTRAAYHELPLVIDGKTQSHLTIAEARRLLSLDSAENEQDKGVLVIHGEGGTGKTTLACQIARWALATTSTHRLSPSHPVVPILIERDLDPLERGPNGATLDGKFLGAVRDELHRLCAGRARADDELVLTLLKAKRLMVILDHASEMSECSRTLLSRVRATNFPAELIIITSRFEERDIDVARRIHTPLVRGIATASDLYWRFLREAHLREYGEPLTDERNEVAEKSLGDLKVILQGRSVTVLLVKLFADYVHSLYSTREYESVEGPPRTVPQVMQWQVRSAARYAARLDGKVPETRLLEETLADSKIVAWECVRRHLRPAKTNKLHIYKAFAHSESRRTVEDRLEWLLEKVNLLKQADYGSTDEVSFILDPLAEYLAALRLVDDFEHGGELLREYGLRIRSLNPAESGFRRAVEDCFQTEAGARFGARLDELC